ncbi:hypothetical protein [Microcoleus sp. FACHB-672]|uniref:hypothetical protein n=1 Tax=Microcoleus sp. FACHB-672 TaxID=2692825 RepID=UPI001682BEF7|nr:hypothetical protein [Microcoleus sp. FACHB-672]MBD2043571.1 hypothetical protein [Microcoleus sp. FACHB-672]
MDLDQQLQALVDNAPQDGTTPQIVAAIAPALKWLAAQLRHSQYYILQTLDHDWVLTTLSNRAQPNVEKRAIYAFPTLKDAASGAFAPQDPQVMALPVPVTHILFQMVALNTVDSTVFFETPGTLDAATEVRREDVQNLIQSLLQQHLSPPTPNFNQIPPDIA